MSGDLKDKATFIKERLTKKQIFEYKERILKALIREKRFVMYFLFKGLEEESKIRVFKGSDFLELKNFENNKNRIIKFLKYLNE